jgi:ubiquinone/menaquinone biosynthesis C-methylase UbiE
LNKDEFWRTDGFAWYERNRGKFLDEKTDPIMRAIRRMKYPPKKVLEFGCSDGYRLQWIHDLYAAKVTGCEISSDVVQKGKGLHPDVELWACSVSEFERNTGSFDLIIFGFCLYLVDVDVLFRVATNTDLMLKNKGSIIVWDYMPEKDHLFRRYLHNYRVNEHHQDFRKMFTWHPYYKQVYFDDTAPEGPVFTLQKEMDYEGD